MTVGYFAPLPPARTGVADYAAGLLTGLRRFGTVRVGDRSARVRLYQIGNNQLHSEIYTEALAHPGVVILHDAVLQHFLLGRLDEREYVEEFVYNYGVWHRDIATELYRHRAQSGADSRYFRYPMLRRLVDRSLAIVVHNQGAATLVREHAPDARIVEIPHYFTPPDPMPQEVPLLKPKGGTVFGVFGHLRETKRLTSVIRSFQCAYAADPRLRLLLAGEPASRDVKRQIDAARDLPGLLLRGYLPEADFWAHAFAVDTCVNLRYPTVGETSGIGIRLMGIGKPVIFTDGPEISAYPDSACLRADPGDSEQDLLTAYLLWLSQFPTDAQAIGWAAAAHIAEYHNLDRISQQYWSLLSELSS